MRIITNEKSQQINTKTITIINAGKLEHVVPGKALLRTIMEVSEVEEERADKSILTSKYRS